MTAADCYRLRLVAALLAAAIASACAPLNKRTPIRHRDAGVYLEGRPTDVQFLRCRVTIQPDGRVLIEPDPEDGALVDPSLPVICQ